MRKSTILTHFCNPKIPELEHCQSRDSGLVKNDRDREIAIPNFGCTKILPNSY